MTVFEYFVQKSLVVCEVFSNFAHAIGTVHFFLKGIDVLRDYVYIENETKTG